MLWWTFCTKLPFFSSLLSSLQVYDHSKATALALNVSCSSSRFLWSGLWRWFLSLVTALTLWKLYNRCFNRSRQQDDQRAKCSSSVCIHRSCDLTSSLPFDCLDAQLLLLIPTISAVTTNLRLTKTRKFLDDFRSFLTQFVFLCVRQCCPTAPTFPTDATTASPPSTSSPSRATRTYRRRPSS